jgi:hypothetical protein
MDMEASPKASSSLRDIGPITRLDFSDLREIVAAVRLPLVGDELRQKALYRSLKTIADWMAHHAEESPRIPQEDVRAMAAAFRKLRKVYRYDPYAPNCPPGLPAGWIALMERWISAEAGKRLPGAPSSWFDQWSYPRLLGFYQVAFGKKPTVTIDGPAHRFLAAFLLRLAKDLAENHPGPPPAKARAITATAAPTQEVLHRRLRSFAPQADIVWAAALLEEHEQALREYNPPNHW